MDRQSSEHQHQNRNKKISEVRQTLKVAQIVGKALRIRRQKESRTFHVNSQMCYVRDKMMI